MQTLYLGLDPPAKVFHYPVIWTKKIKGPELQKAVFLWPEFSHVVFTSKTTVRYWFEEKPHFDKKALAVGKVTARELSRRNVSALIADPETQEGVIELLKKNLPSFLFFPRSKSSRPHLTEFLEKNQIPFFALDLYETILQKPEPVPNLADFDEIVFTSPSTVEGFVQVFGKPLAHQRLRSIGPVTEKKIKDMLSPI